MLINTILFLLFTAHLILVFGMLFHPNRLNKNSDKSHDIYYSKFLAVAAYLPIFAIQGWALFKLQSKEFNPNLLSCGVAICLFGFCLRIWAIRTLGRFFSMEIGIRPNHVIVTSGPYRWIRHPSYTGYLLILIGMGLAFHSWIAVLLPVLQTSVFQYFRIIEEEKMLIKHFGKEYSEYMQRTKRLIPYIF